MLDESALILIAHTDRHTLIALYTWLDARGYFVAPSFSRADLLTNCARYKPALVMTTDSLSDDDEGGLLHPILERSPQTGIILLPKVLLLESLGIILEFAWGKEILRVAGALPVPPPPIPGAEADRIPGVATGSGEIEEQNLGGFLSGKRDGRFIFEGNAVPCPQDLVDEQDPPGDYVQPSPAAWTELVDEVMSRI